MFSHRCRHCGRNAEEHARANKDLAFWVSAETEFRVDGYTSTLKNCSGFSNPDPEYLRQIELEESAARARGKRLGLEVDYYA